MFGLIVHGARLLGGGVRWVKALGEGRKRFFLKKEAKTFLNWRTYWGDGGAASAKVFWFFFSKKNRFALSSAELRHEPPRARRR
jgi:hypothetical protein